MSIDDLDIDDDFLNVRFDPKYKQIFKEKIESLQEEAVREDYRIPVRFTGDYQQKTQLLLHQMVNRVMALAGNYGMRIRRWEPRIEFFTRASWLETSDKEPNIPASVIVWQGKQPIVRVVTPSKIGSSEILIKTVRLLFSKIFGTLFFSETALTRKPYNAEARFPSAEDFDLLEKLHLCRLMDEFSKDVRQQFEGFAIHKQLDRQKRIESGKKEFFRHLESKQSEAGTIERQLLNQIFGTHLQSAQQQPAAFYDKATARLFSHLPQVGLLLPHEQKYVQSLKERGRWELFDGVAEKAQFALNCLEDLTEGFGYLETARPAEDFDFTVADYWMSVFNSRIVYLKRKGLVKPFLVESSKLSPHQQKEKLSFPLWIWQHRIHQYYPGHLPAEKVIQLITNQYKDSIYQKILEAAFRAVNCFKMLQNSSKDVIVNSSDFKRLKALIAGIGVRLPIINDILISCRIFQQMTGRKDDAHVLTDKMTKQVEKGWAYFISFALIHQFYLHQSPGGKDKAEKFHDIIRRHIEARLDRYPSMQIAYFLLLIYRKQSSRLDELVSIVDNGSRPFDFFIIHHDRILGRGGEIAEILKQYVDSVGKWS